MSQTQETVHPPTTRVAFDTSALILWHRKPENRADELQALAEIFTMKLSDNSSGWRFIYLDAVRREVSGPRFEHLEGESEIWDILPCFDERVSLSRFPVIFPVIFTGKEHTKALATFQSASFSRNDSAVLADAVYLKSTFLVTTDVRLTRNVYGVRLAQRLYELTITLPTEFLSLAQGNSPYSAPAALKRQAT